MVINERDIRNETVRAAAQAVMAAARTAPKAKGRDMVEVAVVTEEDIERLAETMVLMSGESGMKFLLRDADIVFAIPMSVSSKNPFFDRKSPAAKNTENAETKK